MQIIVPPFTQAESLIVEQLNQQQDYDEPLSSPALNTARHDLRRGISSQKVWQTLIKSGTPLIEQNPTGDYQLTFLYKGAKHNVFVFGSPDRKSGWMKRLHDSDIWYTSFRVPADTRLSYRLAADVPRSAASPLSRRQALKHAAQLDPHNPHRWPTFARDPSEQQSVVSLPDAPVQPGASQTAKHQGSLLSFTLKSDILSNTRQIWIYETAQFSSAKRPIQLIIFDGNAYKTRINTPGIIDNLVKNYDLPPCQVVFVESLDNVTRGIELPDNAAFTSMLTNELLPQVSRKTHIRFNGDRRVIAGSSYGGLAALTNALRAPNTFGNVVALSASYWWHPDNRHMPSSYYISEAFMLAEKKPLRLFLSAGTFEGAPRGTKSILSGARHLRDILRLKQYPVFYKEYAGGHDYLIWQGALAEGLITLFGSHPQ